MKIILPTNGTCSDVQPYADLAIRLDKPGHSFTFATHPYMRGLVEELVDRKEQTT